MTEPRVMSYSNFESEKENERKGEVRYEI